MGNERTTFMLKGGQPLLDPYTSDGERTDYRETAPESRVRSYQGRGSFGSYQTNDGEQWGNPDGVRFDYARDYRGVAVPIGASEQDFRRGFVDPVLTEAPAYQKSNYDLRRSLPSIPNDDDGDVDDFETHREFRSKNMRAQGLFTRQRIPTER